jgi:fructose-specific phosphotransferase system IIA component
MFAVLSGSAIPHKQSPVMSILHKEKNPRLSDFMHKDLLLLDMKGETKEAIIDELLAFVAATGRLTDIDEVRRAVLARESQMSTGMENGIAIPHGRTDCVKELVCVVGIKREGVDFDALDEKPSQIFILTLTPKNAGSSHVQFMAMISRVLNESCRAAMLEAKTCDEVWDIMMQESAVG